MHERDLPSNILTQHYFTGEQRLQKFSLTTFGGKNLFHYLCFYIYIYHKFVSIKRTGAQNAALFLPKKSEGNFSSYPQNQGDSVKHSRQKLVQTAKYCLPRITYLLIHVFLINFRKENVKLVLLKELKPIILHFACENLLFYSNKQLTTIHSETLPQATFTHSS